MKLKLDENLGRRWAHQLRNAGHDVHTIWDEHLSGASDIEVLAAAVSESRALVTIDLDFANPIRFPPAGAHGILVLRLRDRTGRDDLDHLIDRLIRGSRRFRSVRPPLDRRPRPRPPVRGIG